MTLESPAPTTDPVPMSINSPPASTPTHQVLEALKSHPATSQEATSAQPAILKPEPMETPLEAQESEAELNSPTPADTDPPPMALEPPAPLPSLEPRKAQAASSLDHQELVLPMALLDTPMDPAVDQAQALLPAELPMEAHQEAPHHTSHRALDHPMEPPLPLATLTVFPAPPHLHTEPLPPLEALATELQEPLDHPTVLGQPQAHTELARPQVLPTDQEQEVVSVAVESAAAEQAPTSPSDMALED